MNLLKLSYRNLSDKRLSSFLSILLVTFGIAIISSLIILSEQLTDKLEKNAKDIDAVIGAKGSPLQLILSSIYYVDFPTGNIPLKAAEEIAAHPMVKLAVPLALGDNYKGNRIVGTDTSFIKMYNLSLAEGRFWKRDFEATIGAEIADKNNIKIGDFIHGAHGLTSEEDIHHDHPYRVVGILNHQNNVTDHLVLTNISGIWHMHGLDELSDDEKEITSLLVQYRSPMAVVTFPKMVNESTVMQAASPAMESARLFSLIGIGVDTLQWFAVLIIIISAVSVFVTLYNSLKERKYDLALMRVLGASRSKLFFIVILEGIIVTFIGSVSGLICGHLFVEIVGSYQESGQASFTGYVFLKQEVYIILVGLFTGLIASIIPAIQAYKSDISTILSDK